MMKESIIMTTPRKDLTNLKSDGNIVQFPFWATKDFELQNNLDKNDFEHSTPETLCISYKLAHERHEAASEVLEGITEDDITESMVAIQAYHEMYIDSLERMQTIRAYIQSQGWAYEILSDGVLHFPSLDKPS